MSCGGCSVMVNESPACLATGGLYFICPPQNSEDLVLMPSSQCVLSTRRIPHNGIYLVNSINKNWLKLYSKKTKTIEMASGNTASFYQWSRRHTGF